jgi:hypothetical protein
LPTFFSSLGINKINHQRLSIDTHTDTHTHTQVVVELDPAVASGKKSPHIVSRENENDGAASANGAGVVVEEEQILTLKKAGEEVNDGLNTHTQTDTHTQIDVVKPAVLIAMPPMAQGPEPIFQEDTSQPLPISRQTPTHTPTLLHHTDSLSLSLSKSILRRESSYTSTHTHTPSPTPSTPSSTKRSIKFADAVGETLVCVCVSDRLQYSPTSLTRHWSDDPHNSFHPHRRTHPEGDENEEEEEEERGVRVPVGVGMWVNNGGEESDSSSDDEGGYKRESRLWPARTALHAWRVKREAVHQAKMERVERQRQTRTQTQTQTQKQKKPVVTITQHVITHKEKEKAKQGKNNYVRSSSPTQTQTQTQTQTPPPTITPPHTPTHTHTHTQLSPKRPRIEEIDITEHAQTRVVPGCCIVS